MGEKESVVPPSAIATDSRCQWNMPLPMLKNTLSESVAGLEVPVENETGAEAEVVSESIPLPEVLVPADATVVLTGTVSQTTIRLEGQTLPPGTAFPTTEISQQHECTGSVSF